MKLERSKNAKRGIIYGFINNIVIFVMPFILQMITIQILGIEYAGIKGLYSSVLSVLSLAELGVGSAMVFSMYKPIANDDIDMICALLGLYKRVYRWIGAAILIMGIAITPFLSYLINGSYPADMNIYIVFLLYLANTVVSYWMYAYKNSLLHAYQRVDITSKISAGINLCTGLIQIVILLTTRNFYLYISIAILFTIINNLIVSYTVDGIFPEIKCYGKVPGDIIADIKTNVAGLIIGKVCGITRNTFDNIFMSIFLGLVYTAIYANYYYVLTALTGFTGIILTSLLAGVGNSIAKETKQKNYDDMLRLNYIYLLISGWMTICMLCLYQPFMQLWMGEDYLFPTYIMVLFPIYFYITKMGDIRYVYSDAAGLFWENRHRAILEAISNIIFNYVLGKQFGAFGILLATIISVFIFGFMAATFIIFKHYFEKGMKKYLAQQFLLAIVTLCIAGITYYVCNYFSYDSMITNLFFRGSVCMILPVGLYYVIFFKSKMFRESREWLIKVLKNNKH